MYRSRASAPQHIILQSNQYEDAVSYEKQFDGLGEWMTVK